MKETCGEVKCDICRLIEIPVIVDSRTFLRPISRLIKLSNKPTFSEFVDLLKRATILENIATADVIRLIMNKAL